MQITISVLPPYSAYLQDYAGAGKQVQVFVRNTTANRLQVRLQGNVTGDNGVVIQTLPNYRPPVPLALEPFQNRLLTYADLSGLFDLNQIDVQGVDRNSLYRGLPLPEGTYQLCIRAYDNATSRPLSPENPLGCSPPFPVKAVEPPILIAPLCDAEVQPLTPQTLVFTWTPPVGVSPAMVDYTLRIVELPLETADPNVFIDAVVLPKSGIEVKGLKTSTFLYSVVHPLLIPGKKYAWRVQARDLSGRTQFLNDGKSPVCAFQYGLLLSAGLDSLKSTPMVVRSGTINRAVLVACDDLKSTAPATLTAGNGSSIALSWKPDPTFRKLLAQKMGYSTDSASVRGAIQKAGGLYKLTVFDHEGGKIAWAPTPTSKEFIAGNPDQPGFALAYDQQYDYQVELVLPDAVRKALGDDDLKKWPLTSKTCSFRLKKQVSAGFIVRGQIRYKFTGDGMTGDYPANNTDVKISFSTQYAKQGVADLLADNSKNGSLKSSATTGKALSPQEKLAAVGNSKAKTTTAGAGSGGNVPKGAKTTAPPASGDLPYTYYGKTDANGIYEIPIAWSDLPALLQIGTVVGQTTIQKATIGENGGPADNTLVPQTALNYTLNLPSGYYQNTSEVRSLTYTPGSTSVAVGLAKVNVYAYSAKVQVTKDFNLSYTLTTADGKPTTAQVGYENGKTKVQMEQSINQALDGIVIDVYRKGKDSGIPAIEGDIDGGAVQAQQKELNKASSGLVLIATGKTVIETVNGKPQGVVVFDRLLCNANTGDDYYLSARPDPAKGIATAKQVIGKYNNKPTGDLTTAEANATFAAPEDTLFFEVPKPTLANGYGVQNGSKSYFSHQASYKLRSLLPPTSKLSGRMLYSWPNQPEKFVMGNMPFVVKVGYSINNNYQPSVTGGGTGQKIKQTFYKFDNVTYTGADGQQHTYSTADQGVVMGTGKTDKNGNFSVEVVNLNYKGIINATGKVSASSVEYDDPGANGLAKNKGVDPTGKQAKKDMLTDPDFDGTGLLNFGVLEQMQMDNGISGQLNTSPGAMQGAYQQASLDAAAAYGVQSAGNQAGSKAVKQVGAKAGGGPAETDETLRQVLFSEDVPVASPVQLTYPDDVTTISTITRFYYFELQQGAGYYTTAPVSNTVLVQAFGSLDMGEIVHAVNKYPYKVRVTKADPVKKGELLGVSGARVIIYRESSKGMIQLPEKEGNGKNKFETLPTSSYNKLWTPYGKPFPGTDAVEYYAEGETDNEGYLTKWTPGKEPNLLFFGQYYFYVLPKEDAIDYFEARVVTRSTNFGTDPNDVYFSALGKFDSKTNLLYDEITVKSGPSRLLVKFVDKSSDKKLKGTLSLFELDAKGVPKPIYTVDAKGNKTTVNAGLTNLSTPGSGYFELPVGNYFAKGEGAKRFYLMAYVPGYRLDGQQDDGYAEFQTQPVNPTGTSYNIALQFVPGAIVTGVVKGPEVVADPKFGYQKTGKTVGIPAYVRRMADSSVVETKPDGSFTIAVASSGNQQLIVEPIDPGYWADTLQLKGLKLDEKRNLNTITVERVQHRMRFLVKNAATNQPIPDIWVTVNGDLDKKEKTGKEGIASIEFENVSVDNYTVKINGGTNSDFIPQLVEVKNKESKNWTVYTVLMKAGGRIDGLVTLDGEPVKGAKVYLDYAQSLNETEPASVSAGNVSGDNSGEALIRTNSANGQLGTTLGTFSLRGLPLTDGPVKIRATLDGQTNTIVGAVATVTLKNGLATGVILKLTTYKGMLVQSAYGFPLTVEKLEPQADGTVKVTGQVDLRKSQTAFTWLATGDVARLREVVFKATDGGGGQKVGTPAADQVALDGVADLKFQYAKRYNVLVRHSDYKPGDAPKALTISRNTDGRGVLAGKVQIVDNSFDYPSTYLSFANKGDENFYLATTTGKTQMQQQEVVINGKKTTTNVAVTTTDSRIEVLNALSADGAFTKKIVTPAPTLTKYALSDEKGGRIRFSFLQFPADADPAASYIDPTDARIHLSVDLNCHIDNMQPADFKVHIDDLVLDDKLIYPKKGSNPLELKFEDWTLTVRDWSIDPQEGGIVKQGPIVIVKPGEVAASTANDPILMKTGAADIAFGKFVLRHDLFLLEGPRLGKLPIGDGIAELAILNPEGAFFSFDTGFDGKGHWKLGAFGKEGGPAGVLTLTNPGSAGDLLVSTQAGKKDKTTIRFDYVQLLSNNVNILTVSQDQTFRVRGNSLTEFTPGGFTSGKGFLSLKGGFNLLGVPRAAPLEMSVNYLKEAQGVTGTYSDITAPWGVDLLGKTRFTTTLGKPNLSITPTDVVIDGTSVEEGAMPVLKTLLCARSGSASPIWLQVVPQTVSMTGKHKLDVLGIVGAQVKKGAADWAAPLTFYGELYDNEGLKKSPDPANAWFTQYTVYGDMHVKELDTKGLAIDSLSSKGGNLKIDPKGNFKLDKLSLLGSGKEANGTVSITNKGIQIDNLTTPLGEVKLLVDFAKPAIIGSIDISAPVEAGYDDLSDPDIFPGTNGGFRKPIGIGPFKCRGQGSMLIDKHGFYLVASVQAKGELPPPIQGLQMGIAIGYRNTYESDAVTILRGSSKDPLLPCKITEATGIHGFFMGGGITVLHKELKIDVLVAEAWAKADVSLFASSELNIKKGLSVTFGSGAVASGDIGVRILCASASADVLVLGDMVGTLSTTDPKICMGATVAAGFEAKVSACGVFDDVSVSKTLGVKAEVHWPGSPVFSFDFIEASGFPGKDCSIPIQCNCGTPLPPAQ
ncbi:hypothetical protein [Fibrella aestuarina]|uniref:hypothetical protein n=1 Tax=Fibrella aestuarina TaxID=651143 RepID=UPI0002FDB1D0|nr:hypothetical protein [Fibrella aestuarina]